MNASAPGPELRDIHLPPLPSWWPPAPGWWLLAALAIGVLAFAVRWLLRRQRERRWQRRVRAELERIAVSHAAQPDPLKVAIQVSQLLRRASLLIEPQAAALRDEAWLDFLDRRLPASHASEAPFRNGAGRALVDAPYRRADDSSATPIDVRALLDLARTWLAHALSRGHRRV